MFSSDQAGTGASLQSRVSSIGCGCDVSRRGFLGGLGALGS
jgi:hypothetical protein